MPGFVVMLNLLVLAGSSVYLLSYLFNYSAGWLTNINICLYVQDEVMASLPLILFGGISLFSGILALYFPETHHAKLPDTVEEAENIGKSRRRMNDDRKYEDQQAV